MRKFLVCFVAISILGMNYDGGLPPIEVSDLAPNTVGMMITWSSSGDPTACGPGTANQYFASQGAGAEPIFKSILDEDNMVSDSATDVSSQQSIKKYVDDSIGSWGAWGSTWVNLTVGNGTVVSRYVQTGKLVTALVNLTWGSTTSISGDVTISLPVTASSSYSGETPIGTLHMLDAGTLRYFGVVTLASTTTASMRVGQSNATYLVATALSSSIPFTWTTSDQLNLVFSYEAN